MSVADLRRLIQRATPRTEDVRSPDRSDFVRREHGHLPLREVVDALDALQFSYVSFLRCFEELDAEPQNQVDVKDTEAMVLTKEERLKRYCAVKPPIETSSDTAVHQLYRLLSNLQILCPAVPECVTSPSPVDIVDEAAELPESNWQELVTEWKAKGSECFKRKEFQVAVEHYTRAIQASPKNAEDAASHSFGLAALYSNRCAARLQLGDQLMALADAHVAVELAPTWPKGYFRKGCCLRELGNLEEAALAFGAGRKLEPENKDWEKELEKIDKLLLSMSACQVKQFVLQLLPDILAAWLRVPPSGAPGKVLQLQVNGSFQQLSACKWRQLQDGLQPGKAQIRYAYLEQKGYLANLVANLQSPSTEGFAIADLHGQALSLPAIKSFFKESTVAVHIDVKDDKDGKMKAILFRLPIEEGLERFVCKPKDPDPPKASVDSVLTIQRRSGFPKSYPKYLGFQMFPGDLNFPVIDLLRDAPAHADM